MFWLLDGLLLRSTKITYRSKNHLEFSWNSDDRFRKCGSTRCAHAKYELRSEYMCWTKFEIKIYVFEHHVFWWADHLSYLMATPSAYFDGVNHRSTEAKQRNIKPCYFCYQTWLNTMPKEAPWCINHHRIEWRHQILIPRGKQAKYWS